MSRSVSRAASGSSPTVRPPPGRPDGAQPPQRSSRLPTAGRLLVGTSGFAYRDWAPRFYPAGIIDRELLHAYAERLPACELNNTFYRSPTSAAIDGWLAATPATFRFAVKAQRGGSLRALAVDPESSVPWLTNPLRRFGQRLGTVLFRVPQDVERDDARLAALLACWPPDLSLTLEFQHPSWHVDETFAALAAVGAVLCATDLDELAEPPTIRRTGGFLYLRLRRTAYDDAALTGWAARIEPFLAAGDDAFVFFRHDADGESALRAMRLAASLGG
ncbi:MAG: DUF72 domain-containing protein [Candidatus Limnocylindrales bacterium]